MVLQLSSLSRAKTYALIFFTDFNGHMARPRSSDIDKITQSEGKMIPFCGLDSLLSLEQLITEPYTLSVPSAAVHVAISVLMTHLPESRC